MNKIDTKLIEFLKDYYRIHHDALLIHNYVNNGKQICELIEDEKTKIKGDEIAPRLLIIVFEYGKIHKECWLLNIGCKEGNDKKITLKEYQYILRNISKKDISGRFSIGIGYPKVRGRTDNMGLQCIR